MFTHTPEMSDLNQCRDASQTRSPDYTIGNLNLNKREHSLDQVTNLSFSFYLQLRIIFTNIYSQSI